MFASAHGYEQKLLSERVERALSALRAAQAAVGDQDPEAYYLS